MTWRRFLIVLVLALAAQAGVFAYRYADLLVLRGAAGDLGATPPDRLVRSVELAIERDRLTRRHLETMAAVASRAGRIDLEAHALERLWLDRPDDAATALRYADALRRAGRFGDAERMYRALLDGEPGNAAGDGR